ncbi:protein LURP-one-related 10-like [Asparagus officinalis]|uniref:protein LURP-one-related 10-like n=1 Tax=Asparagus officinalis TaxID=4686 RepID=UPI00098E1F7D|nr:protein LURP-one-related 10-like [Asparagus officinalis]
MKNGYAEKNCQHQPKISSSQLPSHTPSPNSIRNDPWLRCLATLAIVGPQFCAPYPVDLTVTKKAISITDGDFVVTDVNGAVVFKVKGTLLSVRDRRVLLDANGVPLMSMQQKILSAHRRWQVFRGDSSDSKDQLFSVKKSSLLQFRTQLDVFLASNTSQRVCDFKIKGSYFERSCTIYLGDCNTIVAQMKKHHTVGSVLLGKDTFGVTVYPNVDYAFIVALIVILDEINKDRDDGD